MYDLNLIPRTHIKVNGDNSTTKLSSGLHISQWHVHMTTQTTLHTHNNNKLEAGDRVQQLRAFAARTEVLGLAPSTHIQQLTAVCDSSYRVSDTFFWFPQALCIHGVHTEKQVHTHTNKYLNEL